MSPVSNTSARRNVAPETNAQAMSPRALSSQNAAQDHREVLVPKPCKTAKFFNPLNVFPMSPVFVTTPFLVQKALKMGNSEKRVFRALRLFCCLGLQIRSFSAENLLQVVCSAPKSVFYPEKPANSSPPSLSPPMSPVSNTSARRGTAQSQPVSDTAAHRGAPE